MALVETSVIGRVGYITLNRPESLNAINDEMDRLLADAWGRFEADSDIWVIVLRANGERAFCAGGDMNAPPKGFDGLSFGGGITGIGGRLRPITKPLICAVQGHVLGLGFELAMCADIIIASSSTRFGLPEARAGVIEHCGALHRAVRRLPHHVAMAMILASEPLLAEQAWRLGLVNEIVEFTQMDEAVARKAEMILACSPLVTQAAKEAATIGLQGSLEEALSRRYPGIEHYAESSDQSEALSAWAQHRSPIWTGQ